MRFTANLLVLLAMSLCAAMAEPTFAGLLEYAGNAADDARRLALLRQAREHPDCPEALGPQFDELTAFIDRWVNGDRLEWFGSTVRRNDGYNFGIPEDSPLYPQTFLYHGRMLTWCILEYGGYGNRALWDQARGWFERAAAAFPGNPIARMYLGEPIAPARDYTAPAEAPAWAAHQRAALERLTDIIHWWIAHRQREDGSYGGGWGDDCEMWRWWTPVLLGFEDPVIIRAQSALSRAIMARPEMRGGYTSQVYDVEHTAEDSSDAMTPMMMLEPGNPEWRDRALRIADLFENLWTGYNERGQRQFKSTYFSSETVDLRTDRACDTVYHPRAVQPVLLLWQRTGDARLGRLFAEWMDTWADAAARAERGKPAGIVPSAIHWPGGVAGGAEEPWWDPRNHGEPGLYRFPSAMTMMLNTLLLTWRMTGEDRYLEPLRGMAAARLRYIGRPVDEPEPGSEAWCAARLGGLVRVLGKYRFLTGDPEFDALLHRDPDPYLAFRLQDDMARLEQALARVNRALSVNFEGYTSEVRFTDRVLRFPSIFGRDRMFPDGQPGFESPDWALLHASVTGDPGDPGYCPVAAVRWLTPPREIAALVTGAENDAFSARLFHFGSEPRPMSAEFYLLEPGAYVLRVATDDGALDARPFTVEGPRARVSFTLPARRECTVRVAVSE